MFSSRLLPRMQPCIAAMAFRSKSNSTKQSNLLKKASMALGNKQQRKPPAVGILKKADSFKVKNPAVSGTAADEFASPPAAVAPSPASSASSTKNPPTPEPPVFHREEVRPPQAQPESLAPPVESYLNPPAQMTEDIPPPSPPQSQPPKNNDVSINPEPSFSRAQFHQGHLHEFAPRIVVVGVGGGGGNAVNNMIANQLNGVDFLALNTDAQHLATTLTENRLQIGTNLTSGLGCGANPDAGRLAAEESRDEITDLLGDAHMVFVTAGMGGGTGTGAAPVVAEICYNLGILTVGVVTKPFRFEGTHRMRLANEGIGRLQEVVDTLIMIPNQNLFHLANDSTSFMDSFAMADNVLLAGVKSITDLMTTPGLINLDFADVQSVMHGMGNAMLGTGVASKEGLKENEERAIMAAEQALANPLLGENMDIGTAKGMLVNITGGKDMTLFEVDRAAQCITERIVDENANIIFGSAYDESLDGSIRVSVVATGIDEKSKTHEN